MYEQQFSVILHVKVHSNNDFSLFTQFNELFNYTKDQLGSGLGLNGFEEVCGPEEV